MLSQSLGTAARIEDDPFQDLDLDYLDNLMKGTGEDGRGGVDITHHILITVCSLFLISLVHMATTTLIS